MIDADIRRAATLPAAVYRDAALLERARERIFAPSWQLLFDPALRSCLPGALAPGEQHPVVLLPGFLDEPVLLSRDAAGELHALANVCTHRGKLLVERSGRERVLRCRYHGRCFTPDGRFLSMPGCEDALDFPSASDDLPRLHLGQLGPLGLASVAPAVSFEELVAPVRERLGFLPLDRLRPDPSRYREYEVRASWLLYCDNYLEGFHIPFVHPTLNATLDFGAYAIELFPRAVLQVGVAAEGEEAFDGELAPPRDGPDAGRRVAGYYLFLFPNLMLNFYPWGLSINVVTPLAVDRTRITYLGYVLDPARQGRGAGGDLDRVEAEDEAIIEQVQRGLASRLYQRGRYAPRHEAGVHHFHRLLLAALSD